MGSGQKFVMPILDSIVGMKNRSDAATASPLTKEDAINIAKTVFVVATERDIYTGDSVEIFVITKDGVAKEVMELKKD